MKRRYQIDQQRAVQEFRQLAREENPNIQMIVPMAEVVGLLSGPVGARLMDGRRGIRAMVSVKGRGSGSKNASAG